MKHKFTSFFIFFCLYISLAYAQKSLTDSLTLQHPDSTILEGLLEFPKTTVVVFIAGSGPTDRNGNSVTGLKTNCYKQLATALQTNGYATLRYDKRTINLSNMPKSVDFSEKSFEVLEEDLLVFLQAVEKDERVSDVILLGHSQGALIAKMTAQKMKKISAVISLAGAGRPIGEVIRDQLKNGGLNEEGLMEYDSVYQSALKGKFIEVKNPFLKSIFSKSAFQFISSWMNIDPQEEIKKLNIPVLVINGTTDLQVPISEAELLLKAQPNAEKLFIEGMNHVLKDAPADRIPNLMTYNQPDLPLSEGLVAGILKFLEKLEQGNL